MRQLAPLSCVPLPIHVIHGCGIERLLAVMRGFLFTNLLIKRLIKVLVRNSGLPLYELLWFGGFYFFVKVAI